MQPLHAQFSGVSDFTWYGQSFTLSEILTSQLLIQEIEVKSRFCTGLSMHSGWVFFLVLGAGIFLPAGSGRAQDVLTHHYDFYRSGVQSHETALTPDNVNSATFGKLFSLTVDGQVYAQPLWVGGYVMADGKPHNILLVATAHDSVYAFDADGANPPAGYYWHVNLLGQRETTVPAADSQSRDISPEIGIIGTPVIDRKAGVIYAVAKSKLVSSGVATYYQRLHALSLANGQEMMNGPVTIRPVVNGLGEGSSGGKIAFNSLTENQRAALALADGSVWIAWASHGDNPPYHGYLMGYNASDLRQQTGLFVDTPNGTDGGIWMSGGGISVDQGGNLYLASGNGTFDAYTGGGVDYADSALKFIPGSKGLDLATSFTPYDQNTLSVDDLDFGTSACTLIDDPGGPYPHLLVTADKTGRIYLVDRDKMGGYHQNTNQDIQDFSDGGFHIFATPAFFNNTLYLAGRDGPLSAWTFDPKTGLFNTTPVTAPNSAFGCDGCYVGGGTPSVSANGTANAIVWMLDNSQYSKGPAVLHAYDPALATELYSSSYAGGHRDQAAVAVKFTTPTIANGRVYVGGDLAVTVYGLFSSLSTVTSAPVFSPGPADTAGPVRVTLLDQTPGAIIYYTKKGEAPTSGSIVYTEPVTISSTTAFQAIAMALGSAPSDVTQAQYVVGTPGNVFTLDTGFDAGKFYLNGSAKIASKRLRLTDGNESEAGSAYFRVPLRITNFTTHFQFLLTDPNGGGITFVLQDEGITALGSAGGGLGYGPSAPGGKAGIASSAAVKFDPYNNDGEGPDSTGFYTDGASPTVPAIDLSKTGIDLHSGHVFAVTLAYNGAQLTETITDTVTRKSATFAYSVVLTKTLHSPAAFAGFTGSTGGETVTADVLDWSWSTPASEAFGAASLPATVSQLAPKPQSRFVGSFPGGKGVLFPANAVGQSVSFTIEVAEEATFAVHLLASAGPRQGIVQASVDGKEVGSPIDEYSATARTKKFDLGSVLLGAGNHTLTFTVTGKNKASAGYRAVFGQFDLEP